MKRHGAEDLFGYRGDEEREARRIYAAVESAPDPPHTDEADIKGLDGSRIPGLMGICDEPVREVPIDRERLSAFVRKMASLRTDLSILNVEQRQASGVFPEISIEVDESGRLAISEFPSTFPESHNGGKA